MMIQRGVAQPGSALVWGTSGRRFKSSRPDQTKCCVAGNSPLLSGGRYVVIEWSAARYAVGHF
jgi:hypothetical protein